MLYTLKKILFAYAFIWLSKLKKLIHVIRAQNLWNWDFTFWWLALIYILRIAFCLRSKDHQFSKIHRNLNELIQSFFFFLLFMAAPVAYSRSQARGWIGAVAEACATATATLDPSCMCDLCHSLWQCQIFNPLCEGRDWICILMDTVLGS